MSDFKSILNKNSSGKFILSTAKHLEEQSNAETPSVKMVVSGNENYRINGHRYTLNCEHFLIVDSKNHVEVNIDAQEEVKGICIFPNKNLVNEVAKTWLHSYESLLDTPFENNDIELIHNIYKLSENRTGRYLQQKISSILQIENAEFFDFQEFYSRLAECMIFDQLDLEGKLKQVASAKRATKEELFRRVAVAKHYIEDNFSQNISLDELSKEAHLSKYHFTRTFKSLFELTPYQYLLQLRLKKAKELLSLDYSYNEVSDLIGFSDGKSLRKAIKKNTLA